MHRSRKPRPEPARGPTARRTNLLRGFDYGRRGHRLDRWRALITFSQMLYHDGRGGLDRRRLRRELALRIGFRLDRAACAVAGSASVVASSPSTAAPRRGADAPPRAAARDPDAIAGAIEHLRPRRPCQRLRRRAAAAPPEFRARRRPARKGLERLDCGRRDWSSGMGVVAASASRDWPRIRRKTRCAR